MEAVFHDGFVDAVIGVVVEFAADINAGAAFEGFVGEEFDDVAVIYDEGIFAFDACDIYGHFGVVFEHGECAVDWEVEFGF